MYSARPTYLHPENDGHRDFGSVPRPGLKNRVRGTAHLLGREAGSYLAEGGRSSPARLDREASEGRRVRALGVGPRVPPGVSRGRGGCSRRPERRPSAGPTGALTERDGACGRTVPAPERGPGKVEWLSL